METKRVLVVGAKGSGKSALIAQLTRRSATPKKTNLHENYEESKVAAKFCGRPCALQFLEAENNGVHFMSRTSVIMVVFDSKSYKSQQESTKFVKDIQNHQKVIQEKIPIVLVFTKCIDQSLSEEFESNTDFHILSTNALTRLGVDELKLLVFKLAFPEFEKTPAQTQLVKRISQVVRSAMISTVSTVNKLNRPTSTAETDSVVIPNKPFNIINVPKEKSSKFSSSISLDKFQRQITFSKSFRSAPIIRRCASCPSQTLLATR